MAGTRLLGCDAANASVVLPQLRLGSPQRIEQQLLPPSSDWRVDWQHEERDLLHIYERVVSSHPAVP